MANSHFEKWLVKAPAGVILIAGGVFFMYYSITQLDWKDRWVVYGLISAVAVAAGAIFLCSAFIHKIKSDMIRKKKAKLESDMDE
jgi:succinate dehydrogenase hydrophobic anchor subunit